MNAVPAMAATSHWQRGGCGPHHDIPRQLKNTPKSGRPKKRLVNLVSLVDVTS